jgi:hypothetical protein
MGMPLGELVPTKNTGQSVIECIELAMERFNPKFLYSHENAMLSKDGTDPDMRGPEWKLYKHRVGYFGKKYEDLVAKGEDMSHYQRLAEEQDARQPFIKDDTLDALKMCYNCMSYRALVNTLIIGALRIRLKHGDVPIQPTTSTLKISNLG